MSQMKRIVVSLAFFLLIMVLGYALIKMKRLHGYRPGPLRSRYGI